MKNRLQRNLGFLLLGSGALLLAFGLYGLTQPDEFRASTKIAVDVADCSCLLANSPDYQGHGRHLYDEVSELIKTIPPEPVLSNVVSELDLSFKWNRENRKAINRLRHQLNVRLVPNTTLIQISALGETPAEAALIANTVVKNYRQFRQEQYVQAIRASVVKLNAQLQKEDQAIEASREALEQLRAKLRVPDAEIESNSAATNFPEFYQARRDLNDRSEFRNRLARKISIEDNEDLRTTPSFVEVLATAVPPKSPFRRKKTLSFVLIITGLISSGWGLKMVRDSRSAHHET